MGGRGCTDRSACLRAGRLSAKGGADSFVFAPVAEIALACGKLLGGLDLVDQGHGFFLELLQLGGRACGGPSLAPSQVVPDQAHGFVGAEFIA